MSNKIFHMLSLENLCIINNYFWQYEYWNTVVLKYSKVFSYQWLDLT